MTTIIRNYFKNAPNLSLYKRSEDEIKRLLKKNNKEFNIKNFLLCYFLLNQPATCYAKSDKMQCTYGKNRSLKDLYCLVRHYFPEVRLRQVELVLKSLIFSETIEFLTCSEVGDIVFYTNIEIGDDDEDKIHVVKPITTRYLITLINADLKQCKDFFGRTGYEVYGKKLQTQGKRTGARKQQRRKTRR